MTDKSTFKDFSVLYDNLLVNVVMNFLILFSISCILFTFSIFMNVFSLSFDILS
jgi:hypothetical protein